MNVTCPNCATIYRVDPAKVPEAGVRARCAVCTAIFPVRREAAGVMPAVAMPAAPAAAPVPAPPAAAPEVPPPAPTPAPPPRVPEPAPPPPPPPAPAVREQPAAPTPPPAAPAAPAPFTPMAPPAAAPPAGAPRPTPPPAMRPPIATPRPAGIPAAPRPATPPMPSAPPSPRPSASAAASAPAASAGTGAARKSVNPFLSQDPSQKARRLARALISDMVVYHPAKRREGLRDGNLKELFEEEIKKSWEEYSDQVGREVADTTSHFKDALNEILADGRQIF